MKLSFKFGSRMLLQVILEYENQEGCEQKKTTLKCCINDLLVEEAVLVGVQRFVVQSDVPILRLIEALEETHTGAFTFS